MTTHRDPAATTNGSHRTATALGVLVLAPLLAALALAVTFVIHTSPTENDTREATAGLPDLQQDLAAHVWLLDRSESSPTTRDPNPVTLVFGEDTVSGLGPCNPYRGVLEVDDDDDTLSISELTTTNQSCDASTMRAEREYLAALRKVRDVDLSDGYNQRHLVLDNSTGDRLAFDAFDVDEHIVGAWQVAELAGDDGLEDVVDGTNPLLVFEADGDLVLVTECDRIRVDYDLGGNRFSVDDLPSPNRECDEPADVVDQAARLVRALDTGERLELVARRLVLLDGNGRIVMVATKREGG